MSDTPARNEQALHAFADGLLPQEERATIRDWLAEHPDDAARVAAWQVQNDAIRQHFGATANEPVPARLCVGLIRRQRRQRWLGAAAAVLCLLIGAIGGWTARPLLDPASSGGTQLAEQAIAAHRVYAVEVRHPVEVAADQEQHLVAWLSKRLGHELRVPDLTSAGFRLIGGRLLPSDAGAAAQFMFEDAAGRRVTLYVTTTPDSQDTAFRYQSAGGTNAFYWRDGTFGYALIGEIERGALSELARIAYRQLGPSTRS